MLGHYRSVAADILSLVVNKTIASRTVRHVSRNEAFDEASTFEAQVGKYVYTYYPPRHATDWHAHEIHVSAIASASAGAGAGAGSDATAASAEADAASAAGAIKPKFRNMVTVVAGTCRLFTGGFSFTGRMDKEAPVSECVLSAEQTDTHVRASTELQLCTWHKISAGELGVVLRMAVPGPNDPTLKLQWLTDSDE